MATAPPSSPLAPPEVAGPAHVGVVSFLAARAAPTGGFWIALAGGVALARVAERRGPRLGFGASAASMLETVINTRIAEDTKSGYARSGGAFRGNEHRLLSVRIGRTLSKKRLI